MAEHVCGVEPKPLRLAALISGSGRLVQTIADTIAAEQLNARIVTVISSRPGVFGLERAAKLGLPAHVVNRKEYADTETFSDAIWHLIRQAGADVVCLMGFLRLIVIPDDYRDRVINIHPALLPSFGGAGMYGHHVHEAVLEAGCKVSGCSVHFADQTYDTGPIIVQRTCPVLEDDTADTLAARVFEQERKAYVEAMQLIAADRVDSGPEVLDTD
jgi:phosphoribosylglycinamide formyltransferase-1